MSNLPLPDPNESEQATVARAQAGEMAAFEVLYETHVGRTYALCRRFCGDAAAADEMTQAVFVRAWERLSGFRGEAMFGTWLHRLAVNVLLSDRRAEGRRQLRLLDAGEMALSEAVVAPREVAIDLCRALDGLPPRARQVFVLHDIEGWSHDAIALSMETTVGTSKGQLHRARALMREALS